MEKMELQITMMTPLWTGGSETGTMDHVHETGLMGSLRWWYEAIERGRKNHRGCDPTTHTCKYDRDKPNNGLCSACDLFGATGWKRRFRLDVIQEQLDPAWNSDMLRILPRGRHNGWRLPPGMTGRLTLQILGRDESAKKIAGLLLFLENRGGLGAKQSLGYGGFEIENRSEIQKVIPKRTQIPPRKSSDEYPNLQDITFFKVRFQPRHQKWWERADGIQQLRQDPKQWKILAHLSEQGMVPVSPVVKNYWRFRQKWPSPKAAQWLFGTVGRYERLRSKVNPGWAVRQKDNNTWLISGWIWLPFNRDIQYHYAKIRSQALALLSNRTHWLDALALKGNVGNMQITLTTGPDAWNEAAKTGGGAND